MTLLEFIYTGEINCSLNAPTIQGLLQSKQTSRNNIVVVVVEFNF